MATIEINAGGRYVKVHQDGRDAETLLPHAKELWDHTDGAKHEDPGPGFGFREERRWTPTHGATSPGPYGRPTVAPANAAAEPAGCQQVEGQP